MHANKQITQGTATVTIGYDNANRRTSLTLPNGVVVAYGYDAASRVTSITYTQGQTTIGNLTYSYDANGRRISMGGSLAKVNLPAAVSSASYNANNQLTNWNGTTINYDLDGNLTFDGGATYTWNARNQLSAFGATNFTYDSFGRRTLNASGKSFLYDGANAVQELSGSTVTANLLTGLGVDEIFTRTDAASVRDFLTDALGSTLALTDSTGTVQTQYSYEPFGKTTVTGQTNTSTFQYTGRENDGTGLYYYRARYYNPTYGRFIGEDPVGLIGGINYFAYVEDNPITGLDPSGLTLQGTEGPQDIPGGGFGGRYGRDLPPGCLAATADGKCLLNWHAMCSASAGQRILNSMRNSAITGSILGALGGAVAGFGIGSIGAGAAGAAGGAVAGAGIGAINGGLIAGICYVSGQYP